MKDLQLSISVLDGLGGNFQQYLLSSFQVFWERIQKIEIRLGSRLQADITLFAVKLIKRAKSSMLCIGGTDQPNNNLLSR